MIGWLRGVLIEKNSPKIILDVHGIGFDIELPMRVFHELPALEQTVALYIYSHYREDSQQLFGFLQIQDKTAFQLLIKVSGIGVKSALAIVSILEPDALAQAIDDKDINILSSVPGIGKKTAERLVLELQGKLKVAQIPSIQKPVANLTLCDDVTQALLALGYGIKEIQKVLKQLPPELEISQAIKWALSQMLILGK